MARLSRPTLLPIDPFGTPDRGFATMRVTSPYGYRDDPLNPGRQVFHGALDIGNARLGDIVTAVGPGKVYLASSQPSPPWNYASPAGASWSGPSYGGNVVVINHGSGLFSQYAHLGRMDVRFGDTVEAGQPIGVIGETGSAYQRGHLHFGIRDTTRLGNGHDGFVDPWPLIESAQERDVLGGKTVFLSDPYRARIAKGVSIRTDTRLDESSRESVTAAPLEVTIIGRASGADYQGSRNWHVFGQNKTGLRCVHSSLTERIPDEAPPPPPPADCSELEARITVAIEALRGTQ